MVKPDDFSVDKFDVVIGNPPYVSMHNMKLEQRQSCEKILKGIKIFCVHYRSERELMGILYCIVYHFYARAEKLHGFYQAA